MNKIPVVVFNEHKDAYYVWNELIFQKKIPESRNHLLHIDYHPDTSAGRYLPWNFERPKNSEENFRISDDILGISIFRPGQRFAHRKCFT